MTESNVITIQNKYKCPVLTRCGSSWLCRSNGYLLTQIRSFITTWVVKPFAVILVWCGKHQAIANSITCASSKYNVNTIYCCLIECALISGPNYRKPKWSDCISIWWKTGTADTYTDNTTCTVIYLDYMKSHSSYTLLIIL